MDLRITPQTTLTNALAALEQQTSRIGKLQQQAVSGKKVLTASDDPKSVGAILSAKSQDARLDTYLTAIQESRATLNAGVSALQEAADVLSQAQALAVEGSHAANSATAHEVLAQQVDLLLNRLLEAANVTHAGRSLFAGTASTTTAFAVTQTDSQGRPLAIGYQGAGERNFVPISPQQGVATLYAGEDVFQRNGDDAFAALIALRDDLRNQAGLSETAQLESISTRIDAIRQARDNVLAGMGEQSASLQHLDSLETHVRDAQLNVKELLGQLEDADLSEIVVQLRAQENQLQLTLATIARLEQQSLLDFMS